MEFESSYSNANNLLLRDLMLNAVVLINNIEDMWRNNRLSAAAGPVEDRQNHEPEIHNYWAELSLSFHHIFNEVLRSRSLGNTYKGYNAF